MRNRKEFLEAWKMAVARIGPQYFGPESIETAKSHWDLTPNEEAIKDIIRKRGTGQAQFIVAAMSFYNSYWAQELLLKSRLDKSFFGLVSTVDDEGVEILVALLCNFPGW